MDPVVEAPAQVEIVVLVGDDREVVRHEQERIVQLEVQMCQHRTGIVS